MIVGTHAQPPVAYRDVLYLDAVPINSELPAAGTGSADDSRRLKGLCLGRGCRIRELSLTGNRSKNQSQVLCCYRNPDERDRDSGSRSLSRIAIQSISNANPIQIEAPESAPPKPRNDVPRIWDLESSFVISDL